MERTEEWKSILKLHVSAINSSSANHEISVSEGLRLAGHISLNLNGNEALLNKMGKLCGNLINILRFANLNLDPPSSLRTAKKEFSNDPTTAIAEISEVFQVKMVSIQNELQQLKRMLEDQNKFLVGTKVAYKYFCIFSKFGR